jgi:hypothetical protein
MWSSKIKFTSAGEEVLDGSEEAAFSGKARGERSGSGFGDHSAD